MSLAQHEENFWIAHNRCKAKDYGEYPDAQAASGLVSKEKLAPKFIPHPYRQVRRDEVRILEMVA